MARTGLRMMPTFPLPPLKFRTAGFPQYGFKASLSDRACPTALAVKPAPGIPTSTVGLPRPFRPLPARALLAWRCVQTKASLPQAAAREACGLSTPGVLGSGPSSVVSGPPRLVRTPSASLAGTQRFHGLAAYTPRLRCAGGRASATRETFPTFPAMPSPRAVDPTPVGPRGPPVVLAPRYQASSSYERVATHETRLSEQSSTGYVFRRCIVRVMLRPACLPGPPGWLQRGAVTCAAPRLLRDRVTPAFTASVTGHRGESGLRGERETSPRRDSHPTGSWQVVRLHRRVTINPRCPRYFARSGSRS